MKAPPKKKKIAIIGTQASGKGTQAFILSVTTGSPATSMGNILREYETEDSDRGRAIREHLQNSSFPPDAIVLDLIKDWISKRPKGWIIDGFPRTLAQAEQSAEFFKPEAVVYLTLPDEDARRRISYRRVCSKCKTNYNIITQPPKNSEGKCDVCGGELIRRPDDTPELVDKRLKLFHETTEPVRESFRKRGILYEIDARPGLKEVAHEIEVRLAEGGRKQVRHSRFFLWLAVLFLTAALVFAAFVVTGYFLTY